MIGLTVLILISAISGAGYLFWKNNKSSNNVRFNNLITSVETSLNEAGSLRDSDPKQAAEKLEELHSKMKAKGMSPIVSHEYAVRDHKDQAAHHKAEKERLEKE